jgi:hypothetical protein
MLESKYWDKDVQANTAESYQDYLRRYPQGAYASTAREERAFLTIDRNVPASLDAYVRDYPTSRHRAEIDRLREELAWQRAQKNDEGSLNAFISAFPHGRHADTAKAKLTDLRDDALRLAGVRDEAAWQRTNRNDEKSLNAYLNDFPEGKHRDEAEKALAGLRPLPPRREEIIAALENYKTAYEHVNFNEMTAIWPGAPRSIQESFADLKRTTLTYGIIGEPSVTPDTAIVTIDQTLTPVPKSGASAGTFRKRLTVTLHKRGSAQGAAAVWLIESMTAK